MPPEILQTSIPKPDLSDSLSWASVSRTHEEWLRQVGPQLGLDVPKLILGDVLSSIIGDDFGSFGMYFMKDTANITKASILERMDWEISVPETPQPIKTRLQKVIELIEPLDLTNEANFNLARETWVEVRDLVEQQAKVKKDWKEALKYDLEVGKIWSPYWQEFLYGQK